MVFDFSFTIPVSRQMRERLLTIFQDAENLPIPMKVFGHPAKVFLVKAEEGLALTVAGHFTSGRQEFTEDVIVVLEH